MCVYVFACFNQFRTHCHSPWFQYWAEIWTTHIHTHKYAAIYWPLKHLWLQQRHMCACWPLNAGLLLCSIRFVCFGHIRNLNVKSFKLRILDFIDYPPKAIKCGNLVCFLLKLFACPLLIISFIKCFFWKDTCPNLTMLDFYCFIFMGHFLFDFFSVAFCSNWLKVCQ